MNENAKTTGGTFVEESVRVVDENRLNLADTLTSLLVVADTKEALLAGLKSMGMINDGDFAEESLEDIQRRVTDSIDEFRGGVVALTEYSYDLGSIVAVTKDAVVVSAQETNEYGVSMEAINLFVDSLKFAFNVSKDTVLARLKNVLTLEKLGHLMFWQSNGYELDVTILKGNGEIEFDTCSEQSPPGQYTLKYYSEADTFARSNGANLMSKEKYNWLKSQNVSLDKDSSSWLDSPAAVNTSCVNICEAGRVCESSTVALLVGKESLRITLTI